jgi:hypothetical protein
MVNGYGVRVCELTVHTGEDLPEVASGRDEHARTLAGHRHDADRVLRVRLQSPITYRTNQIRNPRNPNSHKTRRIRSIGSKEGGQAGRTWVLAPQMRLMASACAWNRDGAWSPFRIHSELSMQIIVACGRKQNSRRKNQVRIGISRRSRRQGRRCVPRAPSCRGQCLRRGESSTLVW